MFVIKNFLTVYILLGLLWCGCHRKTASYRVHYNSAVYSLPMPSGYRLRTEAAYNEWYFYYPDSTIFFVMPATTYPSILDAELRDFGFRNTLIDLPSVELQGAQTNRSYWKLLKTHQFNVGFRNAPAYRKEFYTDQLQKMAATLSKPITPNQTKH